MAARASDSGLMRLMRAIDADDGDAAVRLLAATPTLARTCIATGATRQGPDAYFLDRIRKHIYARRHRAARRRGGLLEGFSRKRSSRPGPPCAPATAAAPSRCTRRRSARRARTPGILARRRR
jgi:hypothetical protein